jgi:hypothetical protein
MSGTLLIKAIDQCLRFPANGNSIALWPLWTDMVFGRPKADPLSSAGEHDLAGSSGFENFLVGARRLSNWQILANDGTQSAVFETGENPSMDVCLFGRGNSPQGESPNRGAAPHYLKVYTGAKKGTDRSRSPENREKPS